MTFPQSTLYGHLGVRSSTQFAAMAAANFVAQTILVDDGSTSLKEYRSDGVSWVPTLTAAQAAAVATVTLDTTVSASAATANSAALEAALAAIAASGGGTVSVLNPGTYLLNKCMMVRSFTTVKFGPGVKVKMANNSYCNVMRNWHHPFAMDPTLYISIAGLVATFFEYGSARKVGEIVYIEGALTNTGVNGFKTITSVNGFSWTFAVASNTALTNTFRQRVFIYNNFQLAGSAYARAQTTATVTISNGGGTLPGVVTWTSHGRQAGHPVVFTVSGGSLPTGLTAGITYYVQEAGLTTNTLQVALAAGARDAILTSTAGSGTFSAFSGVVTVAEPGHRRQVGDHVYVTNIPVVTDSFNGAWEIETIVPGVSWTYRNGGRTEVGTGTSQFAGDTAIRLEQFAFDSNFALAVPNSDDIQQFGINFCNIGNSSFEFYGENSGRSINIFNGGYCEIPYARSFNSRVTVQFDSYINQMHVGRVVHETGTDDAFAIGVTNGGIFDGTRSPTGPGSCDNWIVDSIVGGSPTGNLKVYCTTGYGLGRGIVGPIKGPGPGPALASDNNAGATGGWCKSLTIAGMDCQRTAGAPGIITTGMIFGSLRIADWIDHSSGTGSGYAGAIGSASGVDPIGDFVLDNFRSEVYNTNIGFLLQTSIENLRVNRSFMSCGSGNQFRVQGAAVIKNAFFRDNQFKGSATATGIMIGSNGGGAVNNLIIDGMDFPIGDNLYQMSGSGTSTIIGNNITIGSAGCSLFNSGGSAVGGVVQLSNVRNTAGSSFSNLCQFNGSGTWRIAVSNVQHFDNLFALLNSGTVTISINGGDARIDLTPAARTRLFPQDGDIVWNTAAGAIPGIGLAQYDINTATWRRVGLKTQTVAFSATPALDCNLGNNVVLSTTLTGNITWAAPTNIPAAGEKITITHVQDGTGTRTVAWNAVYIFPVAWSNVGNTAGTRSSVTFVSDGVKLVAAGMNSWY